MRQLANCLIVPLARSNSVSLDTAALLAQSGTTQLCARLSAIGVTADMASVFALTSISRRREKPLKQVVIRTRSGRYGTVIVIAGGLTCLITETALGLGD